jgi:hypothetical protein
MNYKDIAVKNEQRLKQENERLKILLYNAIVLLEDENNMNLIPYSNRILEELGMTEKEYKEIMNL